MKKIIIALCATLLGACTQIDTGNVGVDHTRGQVKKEPVPQGLAWTLFQTITEVNGNEWAITLADMKPQTQDKIWLEDLDVDFYIQINKALAPDIFVRWPGDRVQVSGEEGVRLGANFVTRQAREAVYTAATSFPAADINNQRQALAAKMVALLQADLDASAGKGWFMVRSANIRALTTDRALDANIKAAAAAQFEIQKQKNQLEVTRLEAERQREQAKGEADAIRIKAEAIAKQGGAEYVQLQAIAKWNGQLPATMVPGSATPFVGVK